MPAPSASGVPQARVVDDPQPGTLQHDGHRVDHGPRRRGPRHRRPGTRRHSRGRTVACSRTSHETGRLVVDLVEQDRRPSSFLTKGSFQNAIVALAAIGGSTNAVVHLLAIAGRLGVDLTLDDFDAIGSGVPLLVNLQPAGRYLMDDFQRAGGLLAVLREVKDLLDPTALTVTGRPLVDYLDSARIWDTEVISVRDLPLIPDAGIAVLRGNLAPGGAIIKPAAASPHLLQHRGRAVVFDTHRGPARPHRRPRPRRRRRLGARAARVRPQGLPRHARGREHAPAARSCSSRACATWCASATGG